MNGLYGLQSNKSNARTHTGRQTRQQNSYIQFVGITNSHNWYILFSLGASLQSLWRQYGWISIEIIIIFETESVVNIWIFVTAELSFKFDQDPIRPLALFYMIVDLYSADIKTE